MTDTCGMCPGVPATEARFLNVHAPRYVTRPAFVLRHDVTTGKTERVA